MTKLKHTKIIFSVTDFKSLIISMIAILSVKHYPEKLEKENEQCSYMKYPNVVGSFIMAFIKPEYIIKEIIKLKYKGCDNVKLEDIENAIIPEIHATATKPNGRLSGVCLSLIYPF